MASRKWSRNATGYVWTDVRCDECGVELKPVDINNINEDGDWCCLQPEDALELEVVPGYGQYWDGSGEGEFDSNAKILLCKDCADRVIAAMPRAAKRVLDIDAPGLILPPPNTGSITETLCNCGMNLTVNCPVHGPPWGRGSVGK